MKFNAKYEVNSYADIEGPNGGYMQGLEEVNSEIDTSHYMVEIYTRTFTERFPVVKVRNWPIFHGLKESKPSIKHTLTVIKVYTGGYSTVSYVEKYINETPT